MFERLEILGGRSAKTLRRPIRVIGIDLGTTNSTVAELKWEPSKSDLPDVRCLSIDQDTMQGRYTHVLVPSIVALHNDRTWVGQGAKLLRSSPAANLEEYRALFAECKNDMGLKRTYHRAPVGFRSAKAIATHVLQFLYQAALREDSAEVTRSVITVPASFQAAQRSDTVDAAERAGIRLAASGLLDEPVAAFLDYVYHQLSSDPSSLKLPPNGEHRNLLVFDFGGGTCDVAVSRLARQKEGELTIAPLAVSRYHRLGGGDIDRAIVHEILLPQILDQNKIPPFVLSFEDKRRRIQPALLTVAESLKEKVCKEIVRLKRLGLWGSTRETEVVQRVPGHHPIALHDRQISLHSPQINAAQFATVLAPFLDTELLYPRENDYRTSCSIFAPLIDALQRAYLEPHEIHLCLLAGGSSLIPQVRDAVAAYFKSAQLLTSQRGEDAQVSIARGAAIHAMGLELLGRPFIQPICHDDICFRTRQEPTLLVRKGVALPFPHDKEWARREDLSVPEGVQSGDALIRVEILAGHEKRPVLSKTWRLPGPIEKGAALWLDYRFDENQVLHLRMGGQGIAATFSDSVDNPLSHVVNPNKTRALIDELEERLRVGHVQREELSDALFELGNLHRRIGQPEKAMAYYSRALQASAEPSAAILNRMAFCAKEIGDNERADYFFREACRVDPWAGTYFNWALAKEAWGQHAEALELVERAEQIEGDPANLALQARLHQRLGNSVRRDECLQDALGSFGAIDGLEEFHLYWLQSAARMAGNTELVQKATRRLQEIQNKKDSIEEVMGEPPELRQ